MNDLNMNEVHSFWLAILCPGDILHDEIIHWRYIAWRDYWLAIYCWQYFAGDISSVNHFIRQLIIFGTMNGELLSFNSEWPQALIFDGLTLELFEQSLFRDCFNRGSSWATTRQCCHWPNLVSISMAFTYTPTYPHPRLTHSPTHTQMHTQSAEQLNNCLRTNK